MRARARPHSHKRARARARTHTQARTRTKKHKRTHARTHARKQARTHIKAVGFGPLLIGTVRAGTLPAASTRSSGCSLSGTGRAVGDLDGRHLGRMMPNVNSGKLGSRALVAAVVTAEPDADQSWNSPAVSAAFVSPSAYSAEAHRPGPLLPGELSQRYTCWHGRLAGFPSWEPDQRGTNDGNPPGSLLPSSLRTHLPHSTRAPSLPPTPQHSSLPTPRWRPRALFSVRFLSTQYKTLDQNPQWSPWDSPTPLTCDGGRGGRPCGLGKPVWSPFARWLGE